MSKPYKKDYGGLQQAWNICIQKYLNFTDPDIRFSTVEDLHDSLIDIKEAKEKTNIPKDAMRTRFEQWEQNEWIPLCKKKLEEWIYQDPFNAKVDKKKIEEYNHIQRVYNRLRYRKIMQIIQDSSIGLGQGGGSGKGHYVGPENIEDFV